jgi:superoxide dismutase, Fe-Mn family
MESEKFYNLPNLPYEYDALAPYITEDQLRIHHEKHHNAYVEGANAIFKKMENARAENANLNMKANLKELSFHIGGFLLHSMFWNNLAPKNDGGKEPDRQLLEAIENEFGSFERFQDEFTRTALSVEGSGWATLTYCEYTRRPLIMQIEKHNVNVFPNFKILMMLDMWEHAYYIDYKNDRAKYIDAFWNIVNWKKVEERFGRLAF